MGLPSKKRTPRSRDERRSHDALKKINVRVDEDGNAHLPHHVTPTTGAYRGKKVIDTTKRVTRRTRKLKKR